MKKEVATKMLAALAGEHRLGIFRLLVRRGPAGYTPGEIASRLRIPPPTLSFHLRALENAGLIGARRDGRFIHYNAEFAAMDALVGFLTENCCGRDSGAAPVCAESASVVTRAGEARRAS